MSQLTRGILITLEGIDGAGKSTLIRGIAEQLATTTIPYTITKEPGATRLGSALRKIIQDTTIPCTAYAEYLLFAADRAQHIHEIVKPALEKNRLVISDRMTDSSLAYQGYGRGLDLTLLQTINAWTTQHIQPDFVFYINLDPKTAFARVQQRNEALTPLEQETTEFFTRVTHGFEEIFAQRTNVIQLEGTQSKELLTQQLFTNVLSLIKPYQLP